MYCSKCGAQNGDNDNYCQMCGEILKKDFVNVENDNQEPNLPLGSNADEKKSDKLGIISLSLGIVSLLLPILGIPIGIIGLILGIKSKEKDIKRIVGISLNSLGLVISVLIIFGVIGYLNHKSVWSGDGYSLEYNRYWMETKEYGGYSALQDIFGGGYLRHFNTSKLFFSEKVFEDESVQKEVYDDFYDSWYSYDEYDNKVKIYSGSNGFDKFTDEIYYATYNYGSSEDAILGKVILLVFPKENIKIEFVTNSSKGDVEKFSKRALKLLKNIKFDMSSLKDEDDSYDIDLSKIVSISAWEAYSDQRKGKLGKNKTIEGTWKGIGLFTSDQMYFKMKNGKFWQSETEDGLNDNDAKFYGTTKILKVSDVAKVQGMDDIEDLINNSEYKNIPENDRYLIICKIDGNNFDDDEVDKDKLLNETKYIYLLIDHGDEGIEARTLNLNSFHERSFVKVAD